jgi:hypothetical protein
VRQRLTEYLEAEGRVSADQIAQARRTQKFFGGSLLFTLVRLDVLREPEAEAIFAQWSGYPYAPLRELRSIPEKVLAILEPAVASRRRIVPFQTDPGTLGLATSRVDNEPFFRELERQVGLPADPHAVLEDRLEGLLERHYGIPAPKRDAVRPAPPSARPLAVGTSAPPAGWDYTGAPEMGLDGLPVESDAVAAEVPPSRTSGEASPLARAFGAEPPAPTGPDAGVQEVPATPPPPSRPTPTGPPAAAPVAANTDDLAPSSAGRPEERLAAAADRREIGRAAVEIALAHGLVRVVLLGHQKERLVGWDAGGPGIDATRVQRLTIPLYTASIFAGFPVNPVPYMGIIPDQPANRELLAVLGGEPPRLVAAAPVLLKERVVAALYADGGPGSKQPVDVKLLAALASKISSALEILLLRKKILS